MKNHVNGWPIIARELTKRHLVQRDLATYLLITPSAITQAKKGEIKFSWGQLALICDFLCLPEKISTELFNSTLNARITDGIAQVRANGRAVRQQQLSVTAHYTNTGNK